VRPHYERLTGLDNSFLLLEGRNTYMHIAVTAVFERGTIARPKGGVDIDSIRRYVASRLHHIPRYRQRLAAVPVLNEPVWIDDDQFDLGYHVRHTSLPKPGNTRQLQDLCARILERHLDRARPLWEIWIVEGLPRGRFAMISKVHHCMVDGIGGVGLLAALLGLEPNRRIESPAAWQPRPAPSNAAMLRSETLRRARSTVELGRKLGRALGHADRLPGVVRTQGAALWKLARTGLGRTNGLPFTGEVGPHRRIEWRTMVLADLKRIRHGLGGTLNDVVLALVAGAMRRYLASRACNPARLAVRAAVPVNVRTDGDAGSGNRVSAWLVDLPIADPDPWRRLYAIRKITHSLKSSHQAESASALAEAADWTSPSVLGMFLQLVNRTRPYDVVVTNVPGPQVPLYLLDAPMVAAYPHLPLFEGQGLGIALLSYDGKLAWGLTGEWDLVPDLDAFAASLVTSLEELSQLAAAVGRATSERTTRENAADLTIADRDYQPTPAAPNRGG